MVTRLKQYETRSFPNLRGLNGISAAQVEEHLDLYKGYVDRTNALHREIDAAVASTENRPLGKDPTYAELTRRLGFEFDGMILHELYFEALTARTRVDPAPGTMLRKTIEFSFGTFEHWLEDFKGIAAMPGVGWVIAYENPYTGWLSNHWISLHHVGHPAGFTPIVVMDVWEHAFMRDYRATERAKYVEAFFRCVDWEVCESRLRVVPVELEPHKPDIQPRQS